HGPRRAPQKSESARPPCAGAPLECSDPCCKKRLQSRHPAPPPLRDRRHSWQSLIFSETAGAPPRAIQSPTFAAYSGRKLRWTEESFSNVIERQNRLLQYSRHILPIAAP